MSSRFAFEQLEIQKGNLADISFYPQTFEVDFTLEVSPLDTQNTPKVSYRLQWS